MTTRRAFMQMLGLAGIAPKALGEKALTPAAEALLSSAKAAISGAGGVAQLSSGKVVSWITQAPDPVREALQYIRSNQYDTWKDTADRMQELSEFKSMSKAAVRTFAKKEEREWQENRKIMEQVEFWIEQKFNPEVKKRTMDVYSFNQAEANSEPAPPYNRTSS